MGSVVRALFVCSLSKQGQHVIYSILEYDPILDSANMTMTDWARLAKDIKVNRRGCYL